MAVVGLIYSQFALCCIWLGCQELDHPTARDYIMEDPFAFLHHLAKDRHITELPNIDEGQ